MGLNKYVKIFLAILACIISALIIDATIFNFNVLTLDKNNQSIDHLSFSTESSSEQTTIKIDVGDKYINKLIIDYKSNDRVPFSLSYTYRDVYGNPAEKSLSDIFDNAFTSAITNIGAPTTKITIIYPSSAEVTIDNISTDNHFHLNSTRIMFTSLALFTVFCLVLFWKTGFEISKLHIYFATVCTLLGTMIIIAQPSGTFYAWDDQTHFQNMLDLFDLNQPYNIGEYSMSEVDIAHSIGRDSIDSIEEQYNQNALLNTGQKTEYISPASVFPMPNKIAYLPMKIGYTVSKFIGLPFTIAFRIGKLVNLITYVWLMAYAIKIICVGKRLLAIIALIPTNIFLASEYSYDPAVFAGLSVFFAEFINIILDKKTKLTSSRAIIMIASVAYASLTKAVYAPFLLLTLFIPKDKFVTPKKSKLIKSGFAFTTLLLLATFMLPTLSGSELSDPRGGETSVSGQLSLIISHPLDYLKILGDTAVAQFIPKFFSPDTLENFAYIYSQSLLGNLNFYYALLIAILFTAFTDNAKNTLSRNYRWLIIAICLGIVLLIWTALYLAYTPVGFPTINGVQNRYFLPLLFPLLLCLQPKNLKNQINPKILNAIAIITPTIVMTACIYLSILLPYSF